MIDFQACTCICPACCYMIEGCVLNDMGMFMLCTVFMSTCVLDILHAHERPLSFSHSVP